MSNEQLEAQQSTTTFINTNDPIDEWPELATKKAKELKKGFSMASDCNHLPYNHDPTPPPDITRNKL